MPFETSLRGSLLGAGLVVADRDVSYFAGDAGCERRAVGDGGGSVCALRNDEAPFVFDGVETKISSSSSSSDTVYACLSFDGEVIGDAPLRLVGGVAGLPLLTKVGDPGEPGRRNGDDRGELLKVDLYEDCGTTSVNDSEISRCRSLSFTIVAGGLSREGNLLVRRGNDKLVRSQRENVLVLIIFKPLVYKPQLSCNKLQFFSIAS